MTRQEATEIIERYLSGRGTPDEMSLVEQAYNRVAEPGSGDIDPVRQESIKAELWSTLLAQLPQQPHQSRVRKLKRAILYAAAILLVATIAGFFAVVDFRQPIGSHRKTDIAPGGNKATLVLADGTSVDLSAAQSGIIVTDAGISYQDGASLRLPPTEAFVLATPRGGTYRVTLPDGSKVWLNASSTLKYPSRFDGEERVVELTGEAYFEVRQQTQDNRRQTLFVPFLVKTNGQTVEVLGTQFNISAYADEPETKTTLVEGAVRLLAGATGEQVLLAPGEQGTLTSNSLSKQQVDIQQFTAWQAGYFAFSNTPIDAVMRQLERWYDIEVRYEGGVIPADRFDGEISRELTLQQVLNGLATTRINYRIEGNTLTILNTPNQTKQ